PVAFSIASHPSPRPIKASGTGWSRIVSPTLAPVSPLLTRPQNSSKSSPGESFRSRASMVSLMSARVRSMSRSIRWLLRSSIFYRLLRPAGIVAKRVGGPLRNYALVFDLFGAPFDHAPADQAQNHGDEQRRQPDRDLCVDDQGEQSGNPHVQG